MAKIPLRFACGMEWNNNVNSGGGYCKLLECRVCRRLSPNRLPPLPISESSISAKAGESKLGVNFPSKFLSKFSSSTYHAYRKYHCIKIHEIRGDKKWRQKRPHPENEVRP